MKRAVFAIALAAGVSCSFTTGTAFKECDTDPQCGAGAACSRGYCLSLPEGCRPIEGSFTRAEVARFAFIAPLSTRRDGGLDALEVNALNGAALAIRDVNGTLTKNVAYALYACDTLHDEALTRQQVEWAVTEMRLPALLTSGNTATLLAAQNMQRVGAGTPLVSPNASAESLTALFRQHGAIYRVVPPDSSQASVLAKLMTGDSKYITQLKVAVISEEGDDRAQFADNVRGRLVDAGRDARVFEYSKPLNPIALVAKLNADLRPNASVVIGSPAQVRTLITEGARSPGLQRSDGHRWLFSSSSRDPVTLGTPLVAAELEGMLGVAPSRGTGGLAKTFRDNFVGAFGTEPSTASAAYDAMFLVMLASHWGSETTSGLTSTRVSDGLVSLAVVPGDSVIHVQLRAQDFSQAVHELSASKRVAIEGVTGKLELDPEVGAPSAAFEVWQVQDGGFATVRFATP